VVQCALWLQIPGLQTFTFNPADADEGVWLSSAQERLITEKEAICEILRRITQLEEDFNTGRLTREDAAARGM